MQFKEYQHIERFGTDAVENIEFGECWIYPKIDGTCGTVYMGDDGTIKAGSRHRELTLDNDNAGFYAYVLNNNNIQDYLHKHPTHRLFGEWLVPHSLRTYRDDAWRRFYIFDVCIDKENILEYIPYDIYQPMLEEFGLDYIPPIAKVTNGSYDNFVHWLERNNFLLQNGKSVGEGIVIKNYSYYNRFGRQTWAKIVTSEFKEKHLRTMGCPEVKGQLTVEQRIVDDFCTNAFIEKEYAKLVDEQGGWSNKYIPMLLGKIFYELVKEESWNIVKKYKNPTIDYKVLNTLVIDKVKKVKSELFI